MAGRKAKQKVRAKVRTHLKTFEVVPTRKQEQRAERFEAQKSWWCAICNGMCQHRRFVSRRLLACDHNAHRQCFGALRKRCEKHGEEFACPACGTTYEEEEEEEEED